MKIEKKVFKENIFGEEYTLSAITNGIRRKYSDALGSGNAAESEGALRSMLSDIGLPVEIYDDLDDEQTAALINRLSNKKK